MILLGQILPPFIPPWTQLRPFAGELWLIATIVAVLLTPFCVRRPNAWCAVVALAGVGAALLSVLWVRGGPAESCFRGMLVTDRFADMWKVLLLLFTAAIILMWFATTAAAMHEGDGPEFFTLLLGATLGMALMAETINLLMLFIAVELASLPSYVLAGFRKSDRIGAEASLKYVLFGAATSSIMVYGLSLLYGLYGSLQIDVLASRMAAEPNASALLAVGIFGLIVGIGFKVSAVPFHFWCPDVFEGAGIDVSAFLSVASKGAALVLLVRVTTTIAAAMHFADVQPLPTIAATLGILGAITATVGNTAAFVQTNIKRLLAYSSIAHAGYMLCAVSLLYRTPGNADPAATASTAILIYLAIYLFMNLGAFTVAGLISRHTGSEKIADYAGLYRRAPVLALCMGVFMFSLVGLPPFAGFVAKWWVMYVLASSGGWWWWLVAVIGLNTVFSLFYYIRVLKAMYLESSDEPAFVPNPLGSALAIMCAAMLVLLLVGFNPLHSVVQRNARMYLGSTVMTQAPAAETLAANR